jgi:hypothetical protein
MGHTSGISLCSATPCPPLLQVVYEQMKGRQSEQGEQCRSHQAADHHHRQRALDIITTDTFTKISGQWKLIAAHSSAVPHP